MAGRFVTLNGDPQTQSGAGLGASGNYTPAPTPTANTGNTAPPPSTTPGAATDPRAYFQSLTQNLAPTPDNLQSIASQLQQQGIKVLTNAAGVAGKIQLPDGSIIDVGQNFSSGQPSTMAWQWLGPSSGGGGSQLPPGLAGAIQGIDPAIFTQPYSSTTGAIALPTFTPPATSVPQFSFTPPTEAEAEAAPGYQFARDQALLAMQNSAAGKGLLNSSGTIFDLGSLANSLASQNYADVWNRRMGAAQTAFQNQLAAQGQGFNQANTGFQNNLAAQQQAAQQYQTFGNDVWNRVYQALTA